MTPFCAKASSLHVYPAVMTLYMSRKISIEELGSPLWAWELPSASTSLRAASRCWPWAPWHLRRLVDFLAYFFVGQVTVCYSCHAIYRGFNRNPEHEPFDLKKLEKYGGRTPRGTSRMARKSLPCLEIPYAFELSSVLG